MRNPVEDIAELFSGKDSVSARVLLEELMKAFGGPAAVAKEVRLIFTDTPQDPKFRFRILKSLMDGTLKLGEIQGDHGGDLDEQTMNLLRQLEQGNVEEIRRICDTVPTKKGAGVDE